jgi:hypothetical protein
MDNIYSPPEGYIYSGKYPVSYHYGIDIEDELTRILSEELAKEIDMNILRGLGYEPIRNKRRMNKINNIFKSFE